MIFVIVGGIRYNLSISHFDQNLPTAYNGIGEVTFDRVIDTDPDVCGTTSVYVSKRWAYGARSIFPPERGTAAHATNASRRIQVWRSRAGQQRIYHIVGIRHFIIQRPRAPVHLFDDRLAEHGRARSAVRFSRARASGDFADSTRATSVITQRHSARR